MKTFLSKEWILLYWALTCLRGVLLKPSSTRPACKLYHFVLYFAEAVVSSALSM